MPRIVGGTDFKGVQAVGLALRILEHLARRRSAVGVTDLAAAFETTKSRMHRHLRTLLETGYIVQEPETERYRISTRLIALGQAVSEGFELTAAARDVLRDLRDGLGHNVALSRAETQGVCIVSMMTGTSSIEIGVKPGSIIPYHATAQGKVALAFGEEQLRERVLAGPLKPQTQHTLVEPERLRREIQRIRKQGWAVSPNETILGLNALAAPIFDGGGLYLGSVAIVDSVQFIRAAPTKKQIASVTDAGRRISANLGFRGT